MFLRDFPCLLDLLPGNPTIWTVGCGGSGIGYMQLGNFTMKTATRLDNTSKELKDSLEDEEAVCLSWNLPVHSLAILASLVRHELT